MQTEQGMTIAIITTKEARQLLKRYIEKISSFSGTTLKVHRLKVT